MEPKISITTWYTVQQLQQLETVAESRSLTKSATLRALVSEAFTATRSKNEVAAPRPKVLSSSTAKQEERGLRCLDCKVPHGACRVCGSSEAELAERGHVASDGGRVLCQGRVAK